MDDAPKIYKNLKPFVKGQSGNPEGRAKQVLTKDKVASIMGKFSLMTRDELKKVADNPKSTMIEIAVASILHRAVKDGDFSRLDFLLARSIGKVKEEIEQTVKSISDEMLDSVPREEIIRLIQKKA